jgi:hypothetical protein
MPAELVGTALRMALQQRKPPPGLLHFATILGGFKCLTQRWKILQTHCPKIRI